ncbi:unnamed protein product [Leptosia nina]|uniref:C2H2-type domain-containing protein n=1 Tax=Leptosia nina TaxID=320188 RepID=A0AAV1JEJ7_9NEOP
MPFCCICLTTNVRMHDLNKSYLFELYEKLVSYNVASAPLYCCYICNSLLKKCYHFMMQAIKANNALSIFESSDMLIRECNGNIFKLVISKLDDVVIDGIKDILIEDGNDNNQKEIKLEDAEVEGDHDLAQDNLDDVLIKSDSEDDVPLSELQADIDIVKNEKDYKVYKKVNAREIILTKEEQLNEMQERAKSINYLNSPYKCSLCYRGFIDPLAFGKHREKHDESSGPHKCDMCHLRYASKRQMNTHCKAAHARRFECHTCKQITHTRNQAKQHEEWHKGRTYTCNLCGKSFRKPSSYFTHLRKSHVNKHSCSSCGESFVSEHGLRMHTTKTHRVLTGDEKDEPISDSFCKECDMQFKTLDAWKRHVLTTHYHFDSKSSTCPVCNEDVSLEARQAHIRSHTNIQQKNHDYEKTPALTSLNCAHCNASFFSVHKLSAHMRRVHLGMKYDKNIVCEVCGKHCTSLATLKYHQRRHNGERPFPCNTCGARFTSKENLRIHSRTHSGERPYTCPICGKKFTQKPALNRHYRVN